MNKSTNTYRKSILEIVVSNLLNLSNIILYIVAGVAVAFNLILALVVFFIVLVSILVGLFIDIKARASLNKVTDEINLGETIVNKLSKIKSPHSQLLKALNKTLIIVGASTLLVIILMLISFAVKGEFNGQILSTYLALVTPVGLFLMINLAFVITAINLARKKVKTQDYTPEKAIRSCYDILNDEGIIIICSYRAHDGGMSEFNKIIDEIKDLNYTVKEKYKNNEALKK